MWVKQHDITEDQSVNLGHMISGIGNSVGLVSALLFGFLLEKRKVSNVSFILFLVTHGHECSDSNRIHWVFLMQ
jgi:hypothetical protein